MQPVYEAASAHDDPYAVIAAYYDTVAAGGDDDIELFAGLWAGTGGRVLDLATGTGRVAVALALLGAEVTALDISGPMLELSRRRSAAAGVSVRWVQADMRDYAPGERYDLIVCAADSFLHLPDRTSQRAALHRAADGLAEGGRLVLDLPAPGGPSWSDWQPGVRPLELVWAGTGPEGRPLQYFATHEVDAAAQTRTVTHLFDELAADGTVRRRISRFTLRFIFPVELYYLAEDCGLTVIDRFGGYNGEPFTGGCDRHVAVLGRRTGEPSA